MNTDAVSVIIPAYNAAQFIGCALASVENQTCKPAELVVVDDGSTDGTFARVEEFTRGSRLKVTVRRQPNQGSAAARNNGISASSGELLAFMDADDIMYPPFLELAMVALNRFPNWIACFSDREVVDSDAKLMAKDLDHPVFKSISKRHVGGGFVELSDDALFSKMVAGSVIPMTAMFRRKGVEAVRGFDETLRFHEDRLFMLRLIKLGGSFGYVDKPLGIWRRHDNNKLASANLFEGLEASELILEKVLDEKTNLNLSQQELADVDAAQRRLAATWMYAASRGRSRATFALGRRFMRERRITFACFAKAVARYGAASLRG